MDGPISVRPATAGDVPRILELWKEFMDFHAERDAWFTRAPDGHDRFAEFVSGNIADGEACVLVAEAEGRVVGYAMAKLAQRPPVFIERRAGAILDLAVGAPHRRRGAGTRLVEALLTWLRGRGVRRVELGAAAANEVSGAFWRKMGFRPYLTKYFAEIAPG